MKLIIKEYLASLKERNELDALLPELLSQMNLTIISTPSVGGRQYGVDIAAVGKINETDEESLYLLTVKSGNLNRTNWNSGSPQDTLPSLQDIIHVYIHNHVPKQYEKIPIKICICFGGDLNENIRQDVSTYTRTNTTDRVSFEEWGGDKIAEYINTYFLTERLMSGNLRGMFRKSIALLDEPEASYIYFKSLVKELCGTLNDKSTLKSKLLVMRQLAICLWTLFAWGRDVNNLESVYLSSEITLLNAWNIFKEYINGKNKIHKLIQSCFQSIYYLYIVICTEYLSKILPHTANLFALSSGVNSSNQVDVNIKLFDILGRISVHGIVTLFAYKYAPDLNKENARKDIIYLHDAIKELIENNPILLSPYKDEQSIEIALALWFLSTDASNQQEIKKWIALLINRIEFNLNAKKNFPSNQRNYSEIIDDQHISQEGFLNYTSSSTLYPTIALFLKFLKMEDLLVELNRITTTHIPHCNFQLWLPDEVSEESFYINDTIHGESITHINMSGEGWVQSIIDECNINKHFFDLSAIKNNFAIIILIACRHYRLPIPPHFIIELLNQQA
ncbi:TPA: hypothetical protein ACYUR3_002102 [Legionella pneumophila]